MITAAIAIVLKISIGIGGLTSAIKSLPTVIALQVKLQIPIAVAQKIPGKQSYVLT